MLNPLKNFVFILFITNLFLLVFSCAEKEEEKQEQEKKCVFSENDISPNLKIIYMSPRIKNDEYPERGGQQQDKVRFYYNIGSINEMLNHNNTWCYDMINEGYYTEKFCNMIDSLYDYASSPLTFLFEIEKNKNPEIREDIYKKMFSRRQGSDKIDSLTANVWTIDKDCEIYEKISVPFYKYKETDNSYILTTQLIENDKFVAGYPIFLSNEDAYRKMKNYTRSYERDNVILLPADFESRNVENVIKKKPIDIKINIEINLFKYEEGLYVEYKDTLKTIVWDCDIAWGEKN